MQEDSGMQKHTDGSFHDAGESPTMKSKSNHSDPFR